MKTPKLTQLTRDNAYKYGLKKFGNDTEACSFLEGYLNGWFSYKESSLHVNGSNESYHFGRELGRNGKIIRKKDLEILQKELSADDLS